MAKKHEEPKNEEIQHVHAETLPLVPPPPSEDLNPETLIRHAIDKNVAVDVMERLLAMRKELKAERARENFYIALSAFQAECPEIKKTKEVKTKEGKHAYSYAPIESIVAQVKEPLSRHGFSYTMSQEITEKGVRATIQVIHRDGHSETFSNEFPLGTKTSMMNDSQVVAAATTFSLRYVFKNAFGIMTGDEDTDGRTPTATVVESAPPPRSSPVRPGVREEPYSATHSTPFNPATERLGFGKKHPETLWKDVPKDYLEWVIKDYDNANAKDKAKATLEYLRTHANDLPEEIGHAILVFEDPKQLEEWAKSDKVAVVWRFHSDFVSRYNKKMEELTGKKQPDELPF